jgi:hypothetical protein
MTRRRFQYSLRTIFVVSFIFAIICSLIKCEFDARSEFERTAGAVQNAVAKIDHNADRQLFDYWLDETKHNSSVSSFVHIPPTQRDLALVGCTWGSGIGFSGEFFLRNSAREFWIRRTLLAPDTDFSVSPCNLEYNLEAIRLNVVCSHPCSLFLQKTSVTVEILNAPKNELLLKPLKAELDKAGLKYEVKDVAN